MPLAIPLSPIASQKGKITLDGQICAFWLRQLATGLYLDFLLNNTPVISGTLCHDRNWLINSRATAFDGDLFFLDTQGHADPSFTALGTRFRLFFATSTEIRS